VLKVLPALVCALVLALAGSAAAATFSVSDTHDVPAANPANGCATPAASAAGGHCTLRSAVQAANAAGGASTITLAAGTYKLTIDPVTAGTDDDSAGDLNIENSNLAITGAGAGSTTIDANFIDRAFNVDFDQTLSLSGVTITHGRAGALGNVTSCPATPAANGEDGGGILNHGTLNLTGDVITDNLAPGSGGGIFANASGPLNVVGTTISNNHACGARGEFHSFGNGGGIFDESPSDSESISSSTIANNTAVDFGGGIDDIGASMSITDTTVSGNSATEAGGVETDTGEGPATIAFVRDTLSGNTAANGGQSAPGGAIANFGDNDSLINTTVTGNSAADGGGIAADFGNTTISFSTITGNTATGAVLIPLSRNAQSVPAPTTGTGNIENLNSATFKLDDSIVAEGTSVQGQPTNCGGGGVTSGGHNLFDDTSDAGGQCAAVASDVINAQPHLGALAANGGPTKTEALSLSSPALNAADDALCSSETAHIDQRHVPRPQGPHCDIGAFELQYADLAVTAIARPSHVNLGESSTVTDTITNNGPSTANDVTFTDPVSGNYTINSASTSQGSCTHTATTVTCHLGSMAVGSTATVTIKLTAKAVQTITLDSAVSAPTPDPALANNHAQVKITVSGNMDLSLTKKASPSHVVLGAHTTFTLTVKNRGPVTATGVVLTDTLPSGLKFVSADPHQGSCSDTKTITCKLGTLASGARTTVKIVTVAVATGTHRNTAHVTGKPKDSNPSNNSAHASVRVSCPQNLVFTTNFDKDPTETKPEDRVHTVKVYVDGRLTQTLNGFDLRRVKIKPVPMTGMHSVTVWFIFTPTKIVTATRVYNGCSSGPTKYAFPPTTGPGAS
jgi:uncharacterized repeat protein (TIGR01451 family)